MHNIYLQYFGQNILAKCTFLKYGFFLSFLHKFIINNCIFLSNSFFLLLFFFKFSSSILYAYCSNGWRNVNDLWFKIKNGSHANIKYFIRAY